MGVRIEQEHDGAVVVMRITGLLRKAELDAALDAEARSWGPATRVRALVMLDGFEGFEHGADWGDTSFVRAHDHQVDRIAIVGVSRWESDALAFAGAGFRKARVRFFSAGQQAQARAWLRAVTSSTGGP